MALMYRESAKEDEPMRVEIKLTRAEVEDMLETRVRRTILSAVIVERDDKERAERERLVTPVIQPGAVDLTMGFIGGVDQTKLGPNDFAYVISYWDKP